MVVGQAHLSERSSPVFQVGRGRFERKPGRARSMGLLTLGGDDESRLGVHPRTFHHLNRKEPSGAAQEISLPEAKEKLLPPSLSHAIYAPHRHPVESR